MFGLALGGIEHPGRVSEAPSVNWTALSRHAFGLVAGLVVALIAYGIMRQADFASFTASDAEGIASLISLIGSIYAVVFAFVIFVIWGQFTDVEEAVLRGVQSAERIAALLAVFKSRRLPGDPLRNE